MTSSTSNGTLLRKKKFLLFSGKHYKMVPKYHEVNQSMADLIVDSVSINSGYTSILKKVPGTNLLDQVHTLPTHTTLAVARTHM